jgi:hypothetical protein
MSGTYTLALRTSEQIRARQAAYRARNRDQYADWRARNPEWHADWRARNPQYDADWRARIRDAKQKLEMEEQLKHTGTDTVTEMTLKERIEQVRIAVGERDRDKRRRVTSNFLRGTLTYWGFDPTLLEPRMYHARRTQDRHAWDDIITHMLRDNDWGFDTNQQEWREGHWLLLAAALAAKAAKAAKAAEEAAARRSSKKPRKK